jgi:hypothetical protein
MIYLKSSPGSMCPKHGRRPPTDMCSRNKLFLDDDHDQPVGPFPQWARISAIKYHSPPRLVRFVASARPISFPLPRIGSTTTQVNNPRLFG